jgi:2-keto-4-pentenoate hydratase/2-oxohepta-3-ene-1,7-dioic acid hydratase in catechol pathway
VSLRIVRFKGGGRPRYGILDGKSVRALPASPFSPRGRAVLEEGLDGREHRLDEVKLLAPCTPSKVICLGVNYRSHAVEMGLAIPPIPLLFLKPPTAVIGPEDRIVLPPLEKRRVDYEAELAVVIGRRARDVSPQQARQYVLGCTCFNDVSERYAQKSDGQWTRCKGYDTFAPIGPWIDTGVNPDDLAVESYLNGERRQSARTSDLIFAVDEIISFVSGIMTLLPGDVIATGTPSGIGRMKPGDVIEIRIEKIGTLRNYVVDHM